MERKDFKFEKAGNPSSHDPGEFMGIAAYKGNLDRVGDIIVDGAFVKHLADFKEEGIIAWQHNWDWPIGKPLDAREEKEGLFVHGTIEETSVGKDIRLLMQKGVVKKMSIGFDTLDAENMTEKGLRDYLGPEQFDMIPDREKDVAMKWGRFLKELFIYDASPVSIPANRKADIIGVKSIEDITRLREGKWWSREQTTGNIGSTEIGGSLADLSFEEHFKSVLAAVTVYIDRAKSVKELRQKEGRKLSDFNKERIHDLALQTADLKALMDELLEDTAVDKEKKEEVNSVISDQDLLLMQLELEKLRVDVAYLSI